MSQSADLPHEPTMPASTPLAGIVRFGIFQLDLKAHELYKAGVKVKLQDQPFRVLEPSRESALPRLRYLNEIAASVVEHGPRLQVPSR